MGLAMSPIPCSHWGQDMSDFVTTHIFGFVNEPTAHTEKRGMVLSLSENCFSGSLGGRKGIPPVKNRVVGYWHGYLSGARCRLAYGQADATATHCLLLQ